jgi:hypothetical protein
MMRVAVCVYLFCCLVAFEGYSKVWVRCCPRRTFPQLRVCLPSFALIYCRPDFTMSKHVANVFLLGYFLRLFKMDKVPATAKVQTAIHIEPQT